VLGAIAAVAALSGCGEDEQQDGLNGFTRTPAANVAAAGLPDVSPRGGGRRAAFRAGHGGLLLTYFGYTSCPDVCPTTLADTRRAIERLKARERGLVEVAMVTVDPRRDTRRALNGYLSHFFRRWRALRTTDAGALARAERAFGARHEIGRANRRGDYEVSHTGSLYAVDDEGVVRVEWPFGTDAEAIAEDMTALLEERDQHPTNRGDQT
jgi:protein SCO1/2